MRNRYKAILSSTVKFPQRFIPDYKELANLVAQLRETGKRIVLTQGVYDLIHEGHALYLEKARAYGDILIVGVDSDELTRKRKGPSRPIVPQNARLKMLAHLRHVDIVTLRHAHHGIGDLIRVVRPDVLVVSQSTKDFTKKMVREYRAVCAAIINLPSQARTSTSARVRNLTIEGAQTLAEEISRVTKNFLEGIKNA